MSDYEALAVAARAVKANTSFHNRMLLAGIYWGAHAVAVAVSAAPPLSKVRDRLASGKPVVIVCLGDSVTAVHYHSGGRRAYPELLAEALERQFPAAKLRVINAGISGDDTTAGLSRLTDDVLAHQPDLVTVMFGLNDIANLSSEQFNDNLSNIVRRIQGNGCTALICTPNDIEDTPLRTRRALAKYVGIARQVAVECGAPLADAHRDFEAVRQCVTNEFDALFSDPIHPNLAGHRRLATTVAEALIGSDVVVFDDAKPAGPALPHVRKLIADERQIKVLAMPPYDEWVVPAIAKVRPRASVQVSRWKVEGKTLKDMASDAEQVRSQRPDLVIVAIPLFASNDLQDQWARSYCDVLSESFSYVNQQWDVLALPPSLERSLELPHEQAQDERSKRLIQAFDLPRVARAAHDVRPARQLFEEWLLEELRAREE